MDSLSVLAEGWLSHLAAVRGLAPTTRDRYLTCLMNASEELDLTSATFDDLDAYLGRLWARGKARSTIAGTTSVLRSFFEWGVLTGKLESSPARYLRGPRVYQREAPFLTAGEIDKLIFGGQRGRMPADPFAARDRVLLAVSYICGLRVSEPGQLRVDNLQYDSGSWSILIERAKAADKDRRLPIGDPVISRMLGHFLEQRSKIADSPWLFPSRPRAGVAKLSDREIHRIFKRAVKSAGIRKKGRHIKFHILRHSIATHLHAEGWPPKAIQRWMRHRRLSTTERYIHVGDDQLRRLWRRKNPLVRRRKNAPDVHALGRALVSDLAQLVGSD